MGKVFMTVVGTGNYQECTYELNGEVSKDRFIQKALMNLLLNQGISFDKVICFMTKESQELNWEAYVRYDRDGNVSAEGEGLFPFFQRLLPDDRIVPRMIPFATTEEQILETFQIMYDVLEQGDEVTLDVTHGFRSMPMLFLPVLNYAKELKHVKTDAIYYGAFESKEENKPIINLNMYNNILAWSNAAHGFAEYGNSNEIFEMTDEMNRQAHRNKRGDNTYQQVKNVAKALRGFTDMIQTSRGGGIPEESSVTVNDKNSIMYAFRKVREEYGKLDEDAVFPPLNKLLDHARQSISRFEDQDIVGVGIETVRWCIDKNMIQQGYTALEETIITYCCIVLGYGDRYMEKEIRENGVSRAITAFRGQCELLRAECIDGCRQEVLENEGKERQTEIDVFEKTVRKIPLELIQIVLRIKERRNDINHFGMRTQPMPADRLQENLEKDFHEFMKIKEKWGESFEQQRQQ